jgi:glycosyltransferase involved in cell wall biosynthesis
MALVRVMHVIARLNIGGPAGHVLWMTSGLSSDQFEVTVVTGVPGKAEGDMTDLLKKAGVSCHILPSLGRAISPLDDWVSLAKLFNLIRRWRPDIVHTHTAKAGALGRIAARMARVPVVVHTFHGHVFRGYWPAARAGVVVWMERVLARLSVAIVTVSERMRSELLEFRIAPPEKVYVLPLGMDLQACVHCASKQGEFRAELGIPEDEPLVGIVGRMVPIKNHTLFLQTASHLLQNGFDGRFVIVGDGELAKELAVTAHDLGVANRVYFVGWRRDLDRIYADIDVVVNTSINEGTPVALIEAMAARVPVVATAVGGVPDMIVPNENGYLVPSGDAEAMASAIRLALSAPHSLLDAAQDTVLERHELAPMLDRATQLYHKLLAGQKCNLTL